MGNNMDDEWEDIPASSDDEWEDIPSAQAPATSPGAAALLSRVGPPTRGEQAIIKDVKPLTPVGYAASEIPLVGGLAEKGALALQGLFGADEAKEKDNFDLAKARYEHENPKTSTALSLAAPFALPVGPAGRAAQMGFQGAISAGDTLVRGGDAEDATLSGLVSSGVSGVMGKVGSKAAPYLKKAGDAVDDHITGPVSKFFRGKAADRAQEAVLSQQKRLNKELSEGEKRRIGEVLLDEGVFKSPIGTGIKETGRRIDAAEKKTRSEITDFVNTKAAQGSGMSREELVQRVLEAGGKKPRTPDTKTYHGYLDDQAEFLGSKVDPEAMGPHVQERLDMRDIQNLKNQVPYDRLSETQLKDGRRDYKKLLQQAQDDAVPEGERAAYKALRGKESALLNAQKGSKERIARQDSNRNVSLTDYITGGAGLAAGAMIGNQSDSMTPGALAGAGAALALSKANKFGRQRGSSAMAANLNSLSKLAKTKFGPTLETAAKRGKGALGVAHSILYSNDDEYRALYDNESDGEL